MILKAKRYKIKTHLKAQAFDLLVVGGGITGAGIALEAAAKGLKVALVDKGDFASGTSTKSTKLIHGGLRYLKNFEFGLVKEYGLERAIIHKLAPNLVYPEKMLLPIYKGGTYNRFMTSIGLSVYDFLAKVKPSERKMMLDAAETRLNEPLLKPDNLKGSALYYEYRTNDGRLTMQVLKTAAKYGLEYLNYAEVTGFTRNKADVIDAALINDRFEDEEFKINARVVVNAAGPWVDELRELDDKKAASSLIHSKGVHLVVPHYRLPLKQSVYFDEFELGRMIFAIPKDKVTYIGTTDTIYESDLNNFKILKSEVDYLLNSTNTIMQDTKLTVNDVVSTWAGVRPLVSKPDKKGTYELSRKDEIYISGSGLITIAGGKLTGYRKMAERVFDKVLSVLHNTGKLKKLIDKKCDTRKLKLLACEFEDEADLLDHKARLVEAADEYNLNHNQINYLFEIYGKEATRIIDLMLKFYSLNQDLAYSLLMAELEYMLIHDHLVEPLDFIERRTAKLYYEPDLIIKYAKDILDRFKAFANWDTKTYDVQALKLANKIQLMRNFVA